MKSYKYLFILFAALPIPSVFSQTTEPGSENHSEKVKAHALRIKYGESRTQKEHKIHSEAIGKQLDSAVLEHQEEKKKIPRKYRNRVEKHNLTIDKQHSEAKKHHNALSEELRKEKHNEYAVRHHANKIHASMEKAEKEKMEVKTKTESP